MTRIASKPSKIVENNCRQTQFFVDIEGEISDPNIQKALAELRLICNRVTEVGSPEVPWFPTQIEDFDHIGKRILGEGDGIQEADHPSFRDPEYRARREYIAQIALDYNLNDSHIPYVKYTENETGVWRHCYPKLKKLLKTNACEETNQIMHEMEQNVEGFSESTIPQLEPISAFLKEKTGWRLKPVGGLLT